jgi:peptidoglycan hydrolase CwlO-like protein
MAKIKMISYEEIKNIDRDLLKEINKLMRKRRIAARMISDDIRRARKASDKHYERSQELIMCEKERDDLQKEYDLFKEIHVMDCNKISELEKEISELKEENELINAENAHLNGKIAAYEKILKIEN